MTSEPRLRAVPPAPPPGTVVDSSVILDILTQDHTWAPWSEDALAQARDTGTLVINPIIYAEISTSFDRIEDLDDAIPATEFDREPLPYQAGFLAARAFLAYRKRGGERRSPLPDFYIGAHAAIRSYQLLPRDAARYRTYFPTVTLICP